MAWDYRPIMSGERRGPAASLTRAGLKVASWPYRVGVSIRNQRFDRGHDVHRVGVPVISVGNLTTGGTGKTPIVCFLARQLRSHGVRVALVSRGYGRGEEDANDEAMELHDRLPDVPHIQDPNRVEAARIAVEELDAEVILMDDGMQHRRLHRDLNVVVIDATCPFGYGHLLPRGLLREPLSALRRADVCVISRCNAVDTEVIDGITHRIEETCGRTVPIVQSIHRPKTFLEHPNRIEPIDPSRESRVAVLTAIGNPKAFEQTVRDCGMTIADAKHLPDHDPYSPDTVRSLMTWAQGLGPGVDAIVCTHKDLVKLRADRMGDKPLKAIQIDLDVINGNEHLDQAINNIVTQLSSNSTQ